MARSKRSLPPDQPSGTVCPVSRTLNDFLARRLTAQTRVGIALSGGVDSVVLLHAIHRLRPHLPPFTLTALHVHHGLSEQADAWAAFCAAFCASLAIPLTIERVDVPSRSDEGPEGAARRLRHALFSRYPADWLALAHHRDDQAETVLFRLLRGSGVAGAAGMSDDRPTAGGPRLIRPLLSLSRAALLAYAQTHGLRWIDDDSNEDLRYRRNFLRHALMPRLTEEFPGAAESLARAAGHFAEAAQLLDELAAIDRQTVSGAHGRIELKRFNALPSARAGNLLRHEWRQAGFRAPEARWLAEAQRQLTTVDPSSEICLATVDGELHVYRGELYALPHRPTPPASTRILWNGEAALSWAGEPLSFTLGRGTGISRHLLSQAPNVFKSRVGGERLQPDPRRPRRA
ncbi:MAG TPA: tRNA lysidine(34) synthetase TilS, partial [Accumulibacter sp.]|nr:tRNA lysidine(34) synthetase TilS [Accumulibacter sp.]